MTKDILSVIQSQRPGFSKGQKRIADYILTSYDKAAFMTASKLGKTTNVSESTVVRFAAELGYDGYPAMQKALREMIRNKLTAMQRIEGMMDKVVEGFEKQLDLLFQGDAMDITTDVEVLERMLAKDGLSDQEGLTLGL